MLKQINKVELRPIYNCPYRVSTYYNNMHYHQFVNKVKTKYVKKLHKSKLTLVRVLRVGGTQS
jgi:hypothetical protein